MNTVSSSSLQQSLLLQLLQQIDAEQQQHEHELQVENARHEEALRAEILNHDTAVSAEIHRHRVTLSSIQQYFEHQLHNTVQQKENTNNCNQIVCQTNNNDGYNGYNNINNHNTQTEEQCQQQQQQQLQPLSLPIPSLPQINNNTNLIYNNNIENYNNSNNDLENAGKQFLLQLNGGYGHRSDEIPEQHHPNFYVHVLFDVHHTHIGVRFMIEHVQDPTLQAIQQPDNKTLTIAHTPRPVTPKRKRYPSVDNSSRKSSKNGKQYSNNIHTYGNINGTYGTCEIPVLPPPDTSKGEVVEIRCVGSSNVTINGWFYVDRWVLSRGQEKCIELDGEMIFGTEMERRAGRECSQNWKQSCKMMMEEGKWVSARLWLENRQINYKKMFPKTTTAT